MLPERAVTWAVEVLDDFPARGYRHYWLAGMRRKLGWTGEDREDLSVCKSVGGGQSKGAADWPSPLWPPALLHRLIARVAKNNNDRVSYPATTELRENDTGSVKCTL